MDVYRGTLHVILCGRKRIVVCSDSRGHSEESGPSPGVFQKLFQSGKRTLCGIHAEAEIVLGVDNIFAFATTLNKSCADEIGGPIDVAVIDSIGFSWLRKKPIRLPGSIEQI